MTAAHWRDLLATRRFTDDGLITAALVHALLYGGAGDRAPPRVSDARAILAAVGAAEPADWSDAALHGAVLYPVRVVERGRRIEAVLADAWRVDVRDDGPAGAWALVHGTEDGWFTRTPAGPLVLSAKGLRRRKLGAG